MMESREGRIERRMRAENGEGEGREEGEGRRERERGGRG